MITREIYPKQSLISVHIYTLVHMSIIHRIQYMLFRIFGPWSLLRFEKRGAGGFGYPVLHVAVYIL